MASVRYLVFLMWGYYFLQGAGGNPGFHIQSLQKYLKEVLNFTPTEMAAFMSMLILPWTIKPLYGIISDFLPIFKLRRKSYFILMSLLAAAAYSTIYFLPLTQSTLLIMLVIAAIGIAFTDVLCDAVMVEKGQPLKITDRLQAAQWAAGGVAGILIAATKGRIAEYWSLQDAIMLTAGAPLLMAVFTFFFLKEEPVNSVGEASRQSWGGLKDAVKSRTLWAAAIFLFLFQCNPHLGETFYYYQKDVLKFSDVLIGNIETVGSIAFVIGTFLYGIYSKRISYEILIRSIIITGVIGNLMFYFYRDATSAYIISALNPIITIAGFLGTLTIAAKACPKYAEAIVFALLMSLYNFAGRLGSLAGAKLYEQIGYPNLVILSAILTALMWLALPLVREKKKDK
ncbi:MAG: MFS transporter [bacterium]|nr:MFS transporter [bacterium]